MCRCTICLAWLVVSSGPLAAFVAPPAGEPSREERLVAMRSIAERFKVRTAEPGEPRELPLIATPLLRFNDSARELSDASLWAWGSTGRPACLLAMEQYGEQWWFELISLSPGKLTAEAEPLKWTPQSPGLQLQPFPEAPRPSKEAARRLPQMRDLLGKLLVHEVGRTGTRYELRLMPKPLHRYASPEEKLHDGAIFAFSYGTNPELLAIVEAHGETADEATWMVGFTRCGTAEPHVVLNEKEIFELPYAVQTGPKDPYWNFPFKFPPAGK
jgi:hypothetical protein